MRKTKIICTIGPACESEEMITSLCEAGMNVARLNFSHGTHDEHLKRIEVIKKVRSYPFALLTGAITGNKEYYKGFNIRIPHPQSPKAWMKYYMYNRRHVGNAISRHINKKWWMCFFVVPGKFIQYDIWDPFKHLITLDMNHLAGGAYFGKDTKREAIMKRADEDYRSAVAPVDDDYESDEDDYVSTKEQLKDPQ